MVNTCISPEYFYNNLSSEEIYYIYKSINNKSREQWEIARLNSYHTILPHLDNKSVKKITPQSFFPLPWDDENDDLKSVLPDKKKISKSELLKKVERLNQLKFDKKNLNSIEKIMK